LKKKEHEERFHQTNPSRTTHTKAGGKLCAKREGEQPKSASKRFLQHHLGVL